MVEQRLPSVGEKIVISVNSAPYQGEYTVQVLESGRDRLLVTMPLRGQGLIVPLAGGEAVSVKYSGGNYRGQVLSRNFGKVHTLTLSAPGAVSLRGREATSGARFIAVTSGKGGVGKSTVSVNLALSLVALGLKVCMVDVDLGTANLDLMLGITASHDLGDLLEDKSLDEVLVPVTHGLTLLPGSSGVGEIANLSNWQMSRLVASFNQLSDNYDVVILDTGAGVGTNVTAFLQAADQVLLVITLDPTAITDAYALLKVAKSKAESLCTWHLVINRATTREAELIQTNFCRTAFRHLDAKVSYLGTIPDSTNIAGSVRRQKPFMLKGSGEEARAFEQIAQQLSGITAEKKGFLHRFQDVWQRLNS
ncbi:MAG TPA: AAA family ATPase [Bacillota bacterium]|nr:AAA family ATPase [Bacillota bacterium]